MKRFLAAGLSASMVLFAGFAAAQAYPAKQVRVIIPYAVGGGADAAARLVADHLGRTLGQAFVIDPRPGGNTVIGAEAAAKAPADGYTLFVTGGSTMSIQPFVFQGRLPYDPLGDFAPVSMISRFPFFLVVPSTLGVNTFADFVAYVKARPGQLNFVNPGSGTSNHMQTELLRQVAGLDMVGIGYKGQPPALPDLINGQVSFMAPSVGLVQAHIQSGRLKPLATFTSERLAQFPQMPTIAEAGYPDALLVPWFGAFLSSKTPKDITDRVHGAFAAALKSPDVIDRLEKSGSQPGKPFTLAQLDAIVREDMERYAKVAKFANIKPE